MVYIWWLKWHSKVTVLQGAAEEPRGGLTPSEKSVSLLPSLHFSPLFVSSLLSKIFLKSTCQEWWEKMKRWLWWQVLCLNKRVWAWVCAAACQWGPGALRELEKTAGSIWGRLIGQLGTVSMWHAVVNLLALFSPLPVPLLLFTLSLKCFSHYHHPVCLF